MMWRQDRVDTRIVQALSDLTEGHTKSSRTGPTGYSALTDQSEKKVKRMENSRDIECDGQTVERMERLTR
jgi:hypothetical protein